MELTLERGASVARVAQAEGVNANQVFQWRRAYREGGLAANGVSTALLPVVIGAETASISEIASEPEACPVQTSGAIHIELPGRAAISTRTGPGQVPPICLRPSHTRVCFCFNVSHRGLLSYSRTSRLALRPSPRWRTR